MAIILFETGVKDVALEVYHLSTLGDEDKYNEFLKLLPPHPLYKKEILLFGKSPNEELKYFVFIYQNTVVALMPFFLRKVIINKIDTGFLDVSSPYGYSGPLYAENTKEEVVRNFWKKIDKWYNNNNIVSEFIRFNMQHNWKGYNGEVNATLSNVCGSIIPEKEQWKNFKPKVRNNIRKAQEYKLSSAIYHKNITVDAIKQFHSIYINTMKRNKAAPHFFYELDYFINLINTNSDICALILVYKGNKAISAELLLLSDNTIHSFLGGTEADFFHTRPNDFLKYEVLNWARNNGFVNYFLGGGREDGDSLYHYKKEFFPKDKDRIFYTGRKIVDKDIYDTLVAHNPFCKNCTLSNYFPKYNCKHPC